MLIQQLNHQNTLLSTFANSSRIINSTDHEDGQESEHEQKQESKDVQESEHEREQNSEDHEQNSDEHEQDSEDATSNISDQEDDERERRARIVQGKRKVQGMDFLKSYLELY